MTIKPYPEEERCELCRYSRGIPNNSEKISCRYGKPNLNAPYWPEIDANAWCGKYHYNEDFKPTHKGITYTTVTTPTCHSGHIETFTQTESIIRKRIKDAYPDAVFDDEVKRYARDMSIFPNDPWGWSR